MQIERLRLINFRQHENTDISLGSGLTGIVGPNGSGKTTLLEAMAWAIYGAPAARGSRESLRRRGAGPRAQVRVELDFVLGPHRYRVVRSLNSAELYQDADPAPIANSLAAVTDKLSRLLGMSHQEFFNTYFTGQKELAVMAAMGPGERAKFLSRVLGYERLKTAQDRLRETRSGLRTRLQALQSALPNPAELDEQETRANVRLEDGERSRALAQARVAAAAARLTEVAPRWSAMQQLRETMLSLEGEYRLLEHRVGSARERFQGLDLELVAASEARGRLDALRLRLEPLDRLKAERETHEGRALDHANRVAQAAQLEEIRIRVSALETRLGRLPIAAVMEAARLKTEELHSFLNATTAEAEERRTAWVRDAQDARTKREALVDQYKELKEQRDRLMKAGPEGVCPTCTRPLGQEFDRVLGILDGQLQDVLFNGSYYKQRIEQLSVEPPELRDLEQKRTELDRALAEATTQAGRLQAQSQEGPGLFEERGRLAARMAELEQALAALPDGYDQARHQEVRRQVAELEPLALEAERLHQAAGRAELLVREAEAAERDLSEREAAARTLRERMESLGYTEGAFLETRAAYEGAENESRGAELAIVRTAAEVDAAREALQAVGRRRAERAVQEQEIVRTARSLAMQNELDRALTDLRTELNTQLRPDLSELASAFLGDLTTGRYTEMELDEDYRATLIDSGEAKPVISGGEEDVANLSLRLAISQMIAERAGQPLSMLILDEIFGSLDEERRGAVVDLLRSLADRFPQVILVTHIESVRDGFDRVIRVDYSVERGASTVRDEAPSEGGADGLAA